MTGVSRTAALVRSNGMDRECELALVERVRAGDTAAFDVVHGAFNGRLYGFLARLTRRRDVAEDLLEETWLRFVSHADQLRADTRLGPWLFTVARNVHVTWCRARAVETRAAATLDLWPAPIGFALAVRAGRRQRARAPCRGRAGEPVGGCAGGAAARRRRGSHAVRGGGGVWPDTRGDAAAPETRTRALLAARLAERRPASGRRVFVR